MSVFLNRANIQNSASDLSFLHVWIREIIKKINNLHNETWCSDHYTDIFCIRSHETFVY